jgi:predicted Zn-dependent peptidase
MKQDSHMFRVTRLANGLTVATAAMPQRTSISLGMWVGTGSRYEPAAVSGVSHFIEHMLFKGTRRRTAKQISQDVEGIGGYANAFTAEENTCFFAKACHDRFLDLLDVHMDMFLNSKFAPAEIEIEREVIQEEIAMYLDQPQQHVQELLNELQWPDQPLGRSITGSAKSVAALTRSDIVNYQRHNYLAINSLVAAAGHLDHETIVKATARYENYFNSGLPTRYPPARHHQDQPLLRLFTKPVEQTQIALGIRTCSRHDERRYALRLLNTILGENSSSRLFQVVREDRGLAYSISSGLSHFDDVGDLVISAGLDTDHLRETLQLIVRELRRLTEKPPSPRELRRALDYVIGQIDLSLENTENQMLWLGEQLIGHGRVFSAAEVKQRLGQVTPGAVLATARDFFRPDRFNLALVSPLRSNRGLAPILRR